MELLQKRLSMTAKWEKMKKRWMDSVEGDWKNQCNDSIRKTKHDCNIAAENSSEGGGMHWHLWLRAAGWWRLRLASGCRHTWMWTEAQTFFHRINGKRTFPRTLPLDVFLLLFAYPDIFPLMYDKRVRGLFPESDVVDGMQVLHGCPTDVEETDKLQTLLVTCCSGWRRRRRRLCSADHAASAAAAVPGVHLERACRLAERRRPDEAWNRRFAALVGRNHPSMWCAIESLQQDAAAGKAS